MKSFQLLKINKPIYLKKVSLLLQCKNHQIRRNTNCQNQNTKTLQQNIGKFKKVLLSKNEIISTPKNKQTDLLEKSKPPATMQKSPNKKKHQYN